MAGREADAAGDCVVVAVEGKEEDEREMLVSLAAVKLGRLAVVGCVIEMLLLPLLLAISSPMSRAVTQRLEAQPDSGQCIGRWRNE